VIADAIELLRRLEDSVKGDQPSDVEVVDYPPFRAWLNRSTNRPGLSYAMPVGPLGSTSQLADSVTQLRASFAARERVLRFEFVEQLWPRLSSALESSGLIVEAVEPVLACWQTAFLPYASPSVQVTPLDPADAALLKTFLAVQIEGFANGTQHVAAVDVERLARQLRERWRFGVLGTVVGAPVGTAELTPTGQIGEIVGVATLPTHRRRGVAATLCSYLVAEFFDHGGETCWLSAANDEARKVYEKIGFRVVGALRNYTDQPLQSG
jgi:ribosomal protein S18 acetylase RimI-like enzyme